MGMSASGSQPALPGRAINAGDARNAQTLVSHSCPPTVSTAARIFQKGGSGGGGGSTSLDNVIGGSWRTIRWPIGKRLGAEAGPSTKTGGAGGRGPDGSDSIGDTG